MDQSIVFYVDSSCPVNPGLSAWAVVGLLYEDGKVVKKWHVEGHETVSTNQRGKLWGAVEALRSVPADFDGPVTVISDCQYLDGQLMLRLLSWSEKKALSDKKNGDIWLVIQRLIKDKNVSFKWVRKTERGRFGKEAYLRSRLAVPA